MKQKHTDGAAAVLIGIILLVGGFATWQAYQQWVALEEMGDHMGTSVTAMHGTHPVWYFLGTILVAGVVSGVYLAIRDRIAYSNSSSTGSNVPEADLEAEEQAIKEELSDSPTDKREPERPILDILPNDERRILQPVLTSPGLTQIELRDRSNFSKSKVSQTVTDLEKRGLLYREPQGRTYRVYPSKELEGKERNSSRPIRDGRNE